MPGNRKHGFRRGNRGGFKPQPMFCHGCGTLHRPGTDMTQALDGKNYCDRTYFAQCDRIETKKEIP
ncbi:MAG: hypothetical protein NTV49_01550 [Kiritimatiellaeota bacterium]|nr:hypothetical protein [Kiritimatiellota bacterium]